MSRSLAGSAALTLAAGLLLGQSLATPAGAQQRTAPEPRPEPALIAPPIIVAPDAKVPIELRGAALQVETDGGLARTTVLLTLFNPNDRLLEGNLSFPLQPGQQVSGFALDVGGAMREAVPVPKPKAQQVFESVERRNVDPGLLEQTAGNQFRLRVYPIPAHGTRQVRLTIDEALRREGDAWRIDVPVQLLDQADGASLAIRARGPRTMPTQVGNFDDLKFERGRGGWTAKYDALRERVHCTDCLSRMRRLGLRLPVAAEAGAVVQAFDGERFALVDVPVAAGHPLVSCSRGGLTTKVHC